MRIPIYWLDCIFIQRWLPDFTFTEDMSISCLQGLYSLSGKTSYRQISWSLEAARLGVAMVVSLWNLTGTSAALLPRYLSNFRAIEKVKTRISRLRDFTRSCGKTSYSLVNRGPGELWSVGCEYRCILKKTDFGKERFDCFSVTWENIFTALRSMVITAIEDWKTRHQ